MKMNSKLTVLAVATAAVSIVAAMPSKSDFAKAQPIVNELMNPFINGYKAKKNTAAEVGAKAVEYSREAETEAAKFLLLKGAITYYSMAEDYDKAADAVDELASVVKDIPADRMLDIISRATSRISEANAPRLHAQYRLTSARVRADKEIGRLKAQLSKRPSDAAARRRYAEMLAVSGDWKAALEEFSKLGGKVAEVASAEKAGKGKNGDIAAFWWDYETEEQYATDAMKSHAAEFYRKALADGSLSGLKRTIAERRLETMPAAAPSTSTPAPIAATPAVTPVVELPASRIEKPAPVAVKGGPWTLPKTFATPLERSLDLGNGVQMPFCACPAGSYNLLGHKVTLTRPFWISKTPVTLSQLQGCHIGLSPNAKKNAKKILQEFKDRTIMFSGNPEPIISALQRYKGVLPPGYVFRLPSEAEFYYAYDAGINVYGEYQDWNAVGDRSVENSKETLAKCGLDRSVGIGVAYLSELPDANSFGVVPWRPTKLYFYLLDKIKAPSDKHEIKKEELTTLMQYADEEVDPLRVGDVFLGTGSFGVRSYRSCSRSRSWGCAYIVIGPDLESEKKAAGK